MSFIVSTDAAADLELDYIASRDIKVISMRFTLDGTEYSFGNGEPGLSMPELFKRLRKGASAKSQLITAETHIDHFEPFLKEGRDVLHIPLSSGLSGTCENAKSAAEQLKEKYPHNTVFVYDFRGASMGQGLCVDYLARMRDEGKSAFEAAAWVEANAKKFCHFFTVDDLGHLRRGGRISGFSSFVGSILKIKPLLHINNEGKLIPLKKLLGRNKALHSLTEKYKELSLEGDQRVFICHADCEEDAKSVAEKLSSEADVSDITVGGMGPIIGLHAGPGTVALFFMGKSR
ncbi:MAG: DegV family protein [Firmicutes bacterium]|nr:DegV family protein [Bacillota bacterium]